MAARHGFTLVETLVAVLVFSVGAAAVLGAYSAGVTALDAALDSLHCDGLLREKIAELREAQLKWSGAAFSGDTGAFRDADAAYRWQVERARTDVPAVVETRVSVWRAGSERRHSVTTWLRQAADL
jgi:prepilin-type N-terminal cleavage/methylation domain-containing protein